MPRQKSEAGLIRDQLLRIAKTLGYNKAAFSRATGLSYWKSRKLVDNLRERKPIKEVLGKKSPDKKLAEYKGAVKSANFEERTQRIKGKTHKVAVPPEPKKGKSAKKLASKKLANARRDTYEYNPGQKIKYGSNDSIQIRAKGKGKSAGKSIKTLHSQVGDWTMAWSTFFELQRQTHFVARELEIIVIRPT